MGNRLTLDSEGLAFDPRTPGSGWIGDEYGLRLQLYVNKKIDGVLPLPEAALPHSPAGTLNFAADPPANGRKVNQGMESVAVNQDGTKLFALLQSATIHAT